jgi:hypothetical protein
VLFQKYGEFRLLTSKPIVDIIYNIRRGHFLDQYLIIFEVQSGTRTSVKKGAIAEKFTGSPSAHGRSNPLPEAHYPQTYACVLHCPPPTFAANFLLSYNISLSPLSSFLLSSSHSDTSSRRANLPPWRPSSPVPRRIPPVSFPRSMADAHR